MRFCFNVFFISFWVLQRLRTPVLDATIVNVFLGLLHWLDSCFHIQIVLNRCITERYMILLIQCLTKCLSICSITILCAEIPFSLYNILRHVLCAIHSTQLVMYFLSDLSLFSKEIKCNYGMQNFLAGVVLVLKITKLLKSKCS